MPKKVTTTASAMIPLCVLEFPCSPPGVVAGRGEKEQWGEGERGWGEREREKRRKEVLLVGTSLQVPFGYWFIEIHTFSLFFDCTTFRRS
jgi:hypothetical protein